MVTPMAEVSERVSNALFNDPRTHNSIHNIEVAFNQGTITLTGKVRDEKTKSAAEEIARETSGVVSVHNNLSVGK